MSAPDTAPAAPLASLPQKRFYRQRAHSNPIADHCFEYPTSPPKMDWSPLYPHYDRESGKVVRFADVGCGYGGLLIRLAPLHPDKLMLGLEIRVKVSDYVKDRIAALRTLHPGDYGNVACLRTNAMKYLPNFFEKGQLEKMFFLFPDPHFKKAKRKWRIVNETLIAEYAYVMGVRGRLYTITDVEELGQWMAAKLEAHPLFRRLSEDELKEDPTVEALYESTEEGQKVSRAKGEKWCSVFERIEDPLDS